jgi:hypothetical protein
MTAAVRTKNGVKHSTKNTARIAGLQAVGMISQENRLVEAGKIHPFVHAGHLLTVAVEHLGFHTVWVE